jgi:hypothetical protein
MEVIDKGIYHRTGKSPHPRQWCRTVPALFFNVALKPTQFLGWSCLFRDTQKT